MKSIRTIGLVFATIIATYNVSLADGWQIETVDSGQWWYCRTSIAVDEAGNPHIAYIAMPDEFHYDFKYAFRDSEDWHTSTIAPGGGLQGDIKIAADSQGNIHTAYNKSTWWDYAILYYAYLDGTVWEITELWNEGPVVAGDGNYFSLATDASNNPHISYGECNGQYGWTEPGLKMKYVYRDSDGWKGYTLDDYCEQVFSNSITIDPSGYPNICYRLEYAIGEHALKFAIEDEYGWHIETIEDYGGADDYGGRYCGLALDMQNRPHISHNSDDSLFHTYYDGQTWNTEFVDYGSSNESIAIDSANNVHISYSKDTDDTDDGDDTGYELKYAYKDADGWHYEVIDSNGLWSSVAVDADDNIHIAYRDYTNVAVKYAYHDAFIGIALQSFSARTSNTGIRLFWECRDDVSGFNLYRSTGAGEGKAITSRDKLNAELITGVSPYAYLDTTVEENVTYTYWLEAIDVGGASETFGPVECTWNGSLPTTYALYQSRPNPASGTAVIAFDLPESRSVSLELYDLTGRKVGTVVDDYYVAGSYDITYSPALPPGVYVYKLTAGEYSAVRKMVVVR